MNKKKRSEEYKKQLLIYLSGYSTHKPYTVDEWFYAMEYCKARPEMAYKF